MKIPPKRFVPCLKSQANFRPQKTYLQILDYKLRLWNHFGWSVWFSEQRPQFDLIIGHVNSIPAIEFFSGISRNTQSKSYKLSLTECVWEFRNDALWDTHYHAILKLHSHFYRNIYHILAQTVKCRNDCSLYTAYVRIERSAVKVEW